MLHTVLALKSRIRALSHLSDILTGLLDDYDNQLKPVVFKAYQQNQWFTERSVRQAFEEWAVALRDTEEWIKPYGDLKPERILTIGVVNAGNIPLVGLHDLLSVIVSGHSYQGKNATGDEILLPFIAGKLMDAEPAFREKIHFVGRLGEVDAVIATGNNNSARYFEYYFGKYPHIIRKNRNGVAVLTGDETDAQLIDLGKDIFSYFGLGCRNVSKLYVPHDYNFERFFEAMYNFSYVNESSKYMNNFEYNNSVFLLKLMPFLQNGFLIVREEEQIASPISVVHYENYSSPVELEKKLFGQKDLLQCISTGSSFFEKHNELKRITIPFGNTQSPKLWEYADGVDTLKFLAEL